MKLTLGSNNCGRFAACTPKLAKAGCEAAPIQHRTDWLWRTARQLQDKIDVYFRRVSVRGTQRRDDRECDVRLRFAKCELRDNDDKAPPHRPPALRPDPSRIAAGNESSHP